MLSTTPQEEAQRVIDGAERKAEEIGQSPWTSRRWTLEVTSSFKKELRWNDLYYHLAKGL